MISSLDLFKIIEDYSKKNLKKIKKAYELAKNLHEGQYRKSGEPYIIHPINVAYILAQFHADSDTICAGLLHDVIEDTNITKEEISEEFNPLIAELVDGVTKISKLEFQTKREQNLANTRKIITSLEKDIRIIIIKLADRLHNMRTLQYHKPSKQQEIAQETMEIFVPLANFVGSYHLKTELEDLSLLYLNPEKYQEAAIIRHNQEVGYNYLLEEMKSNISKNLTEQQIQSKIYTRVKNVYGIYKHLQQGRKTSEMHDLLSLKIIVDTIPNCYLTLGVVHKMYHPLNEKFKDYIFNPKTNLYSSIHTTVFGPNNRLVQSRIRTQEMDILAYNGLTAWQLYQNLSNNNMQKYLKLNYQTYKSLIEIDKTYDENEQFLIQVMSELFADKIYVYTPKGELIELPINATPIDFAYQIHTELGHNMKKDLVNDEEVPFGYHLKTGDRVRIITEGLTNEQILEQDAVTARAKRKIHEKNKKVI